MLGITVGSDVVGLEVTRLLLGDTVGSDVVGLNVTVFKLGASVGLELEVEVSELLLGDTVGVGSDVDVFKIRLLLGDTVGSDVIGLDVTVTKKSVDSGANVDGLNVGGDEGNLVGSLIGVWEGDSNSD